MSWLDRCFLVVIFGVVLFFVVRPAFADESIGRRLAALRALVNPAEAHAAVRGVPSRSACTRGAWWRASEYGLRTRTDAAITDAARRFGVEPALIRSVIRHESAFDVDAVSHKGAMGLMQLMPRTAQHLGVVCAFDPRENVLGGTRYLRRMRDRLGSWPRAVAAYHAGPGAVESGRIPTITRRYVERVLRTWNADRYANISFD